MTYKLDGQEFEVSDLTLDEVESIEKELGITWGEMNPAISGTQAKAVLSRFLARTKGLDEARRIVGPMTITEFTQCMTVTVDPVPKDDAVPDEATKTSSGTTKTIHAA